MLLDLKSRYCGMPDAVEFISQPFHGNKRKLKVFFDYILAGNSELHDVLINIC